MLGVVADLPLSMTSTYAVSMARIVLGGVFALVVLAGVGVFRGLSDDVDRDAYVNANVKLLGELPTLPGASQVDLHSRPWRVFREPLPWSHVAGYTTEAVYEIPPRMTAAGVARFFDARLTGWRLASWSAGYSSATGRLGNRCYARGIQSVCVKVVNFGASGSNGNEYQVAVDHRAHEPRSNW
jgi:hypothetical protein